MKKKRKNKNGIIKRYNDAQTVKRDSKGKRTKTNAKVIALKTGVDLVSSTTVAPAIGAGLGVLAPIAGFILIGLGHYLGDKSGLLRLTGAATMGYGIAKAIENRNAPEASLVEGAKTRLINFKNDWLNAFYLDKVFKAKAETETTEDASIGAIDLSALDVFDDLNQQSAQNFELQQELSAEQTDDFDGAVQFDAEDLEGINYSVIEEEIDFSNL